MKANVYLVTRHWGGSEEGGWWYNHFHHLHHLPCKEANQFRVKAKLERRFDHMNEGDIFSVNGGQMIQICFEDHIAESQTTERPRYC